MFHTSTHSARRQAPLTDVIPFLHSAEQPNTTVCLIASSLKANVNTWKVSAPILPICNNNLIHMHCSLKYVTFWRNETALDTTHGHPAQQHMPQLWNQQLTTTQVLLHCHLDDEFCTNCCSCGGQGVTGGSLTLQMEGHQCWWIWEPTYGGGEVPNKTKTMRHILLASENFMFYIQFLQNSIQYTTNNFPNTTQVQFNSSHRLTVSSKPCCNPALKLTQSPIQKLLSALTPTANFLEQSQYWGWESVKS